MKKIIISRWLLSFATALVPLLGEAQDLTYAQRVTDLNPGGVGSFPSNLVVFGDALYFSAYTLNTGRELWKYDGNGVTLTTNINDTADDIGFGVLEGNDSIPEWLTDFRGEIFLSAFDPRRGGELWRYNGTTAIRAADINPDPNDTIKFMPNSSWPRELTVLGTNLYFVADNGFQIPNYELWKYDGTSAAMVRDIHINIGSNYSSYPSGLSTFDDSLYFMADDGVNGYELWKHNAAGTILLTNINPGGATSSSWPKSFTALGDELLFAAYNDTHGYELWKTDGTNTVMVADVNQAGSSNPEFLTVFNGSLYFRAADGITGYELWKYDGTGVTRAADINPSGDSSPKGLMVFQDKLYFAADDGVHGWELWSYDGASASLVADINSAGDSFPELLTICNSNLYFTATNATTGYEVWRFDGQQVSLAADINPGPASSYPLYLGVFGDALYVSANDSAFSDWELWAIKSTTLRVTLIQQVGGEVRISWNTIGGTTNVVQYADTLDGVFQDLSEPLIIAGTAATTAEFTDPLPIVNGSSRFYRVVSR